MNMKILLLAISVFLLSTHFVFANGTTLVQASDEQVIVDGNYNKAKKDAIAGALRNAVEQGAGTIIDTKVIVRNFKLVEDRIFSSARGFIKSYKIISEKKKKNDGITSLYIKINAYISRDKLESALNSIESLRVKQMERGNKSVIVIYDPRASSATLPLKFSDPNEREVILTAIEKINEILLQKQFNVFDLNRVIKVNEEIHKKSKKSKFEDKALEVANSNSADILITLRLVSYIEKDNILSWAFSELTAKAVNAGNGQMIGTSRKKGKTGFSLKASGGEVFAKMASASVKASKKAGLDIVKQILISAPPKEMLLTVFKGLSPRQKRAVQKKISLVPNYKSHRVIKQTKNSIEIELDIESGKNSDIALNISETVEKDKYFKGYLLDAGCQRNRCIFNVIKD